LSIRPRHCSDNGSGSRAEKIARADVTFYTNKSKGKKQKISRGRIINVNNYNPDPEFVKKFAAQRKMVMDYVDKEIAVSEKTITSRIHISVFSIC